MPVILSQRIDTASDYEDVPFRTYHFPARYRRQVKPGDQFVYYQGNRHRRAHRYYFGCGVVGRIVERVDGASFDADLIDSRRFAAPVPIYNPDGGFLESLGFATVRKSENPPWQNSIRPLSEEAMEAILAAADIDAASLNVASEIESQTAELHALETLNDRYGSLSPEIRRQRVATHLDRGVAVTASLKKLLGPTCQICGWEGVSKDRW